MRSFVVKKLFILAISLIISSPLFGGIFLNEISAGGPQDWVEVKISPDTASMDISSLYVTMYYGTNEKIADSAVTLYGSDRPETPWDDRFAVIHFTGTGGDDETDARGDMNSNGIRDLYCDNYGLWNTDCCVAIDSDDNPANNGILDFAAFSNRDGSMNSSIESYIRSAVAFSAWKCTCSNTQECCVFTGAKGMESYSTLSRGNGDTNSMEDFFLTPYATPGKENITCDLRGTKGVLRPIKKTVTYTFASNSGSIYFPLFLYGETSIRVRIFNSSGMPVYTGPVLSDLAPGYYTVRLNNCELKGRILTGLYPVSIEAVSSDTGKTENIRIKLIIIREK